MKATNPIAAAALALSMLAVAPPASAQTGAVELIDEPVNIISLGLSMRLPVGAGYETTRMTGAKAAFNMVAADQLWTLALHNPSSEDDSLTTVGVADHLLEQLARANATTGATETVLFRNDELRINGKPASRFYVKVTPALRKDPIVTGYTIFWTAPGEFAIFQFDCKADDYDTARPEYETVMATAVFRDPQVVAQERVAGIDAANALFGALTPEDLNQLLATPHVQFYRTYMPVQGGARGESQEIGYQRVEMRTGYRGDLDPNKPRNRWGRADKDPGFIVRVTGRQLQDQMLIDVDAIYFLSQDRQEEVWRVVMEAHQDNQREAWLETGAHLNGTIKVSVTQGSQPTQSKQWKTPPDAYISQVEHLILGRLLVSRGDVGAYNFYYYNAQMSDLLLRRDVLEPIQSRGPEKWRLTSKNAENLPESVKTYDARGNLLRVEEANGVIKEPIALDQLRRLWRSKGLPLS